MNSTAFLFLTSKVRLHCDGQGSELLTYAVSQLFLTSKVRLHCDDLAVIIAGSAITAFS